MKKGGYRPDGRLETLKDELWITLQLLVDNPCAEARKRLSREAIRLVRDARRLMGPRGGMPPMGLAGA